MDTQLKSGHVWIDVVAGREGPSLSIGNNDGGYRLAGPKPWGGGSTIHRFMVSIEEIQREAAALAPSDAVEAPTVPDMVWLKEDPEHFANYSIGDAVSDYVNSNCPVPSAGGEIEFETAKRLPDVKVRVWRTERLNDDDPGYGWEIIDAAPVAPAAVEPLTDEQMRLEFEAWGKTRIWGKKYDSFDRFDYGFLGDDAYKTDPLGDYKHSSVEGYWIGWRHCWARVRALLAAPTPTVAAAQPVSHAPLTDRLLDREVWSHADIFLARGKRGGVQVHFGDHTNLMRFSRALIRAALDAEYLAAAPAVAADAVAPKSNRDVTQLTDWLLTDPQTGEKLHFAGPLEPDFLRFSRVRMESKSGAVWTLSARLEEGYLTAAERLANIKRAAQESGND